MYSYFNEKTAANVIKSMIRAKNVREDLRTTWIDDNGRQCACDGYRAYRIKAPIAGLADAGKTVINLDKIFPQDMGEFKQLDAPTLDELNALADDDKAHTIRTRKGQTVYDDDAPRGVYMFGNDEKPVVNLAFLRDMLKLYPDAEIYYKNNVSILYFKSAGGDGALLPIRYDKPRARRPIPAPRTKSKPAAPAFSLAQFAARYAM